MAAEETQIMNIIIDAAPMYGLALDFIPEYYNYIFEFENKCVSDQQFPTSWPVIRFRGFHKRQFFLNCCNLCNCLSFDQTLQKSSAKQLHNPQQMQNTIKKAILYEQTVNKHTPTIM